MAYEDLTNDLGVQRNMMAQLKPKPKYRIKEYDRKFMPQRLSQMQQPSFLAEDGYVNIGIQWFKTIGEARDVLAQMERADNLIPIYHPYP